MKKEMINLKVNDFIKANLNTNIAANRKDSEYDFNFTRWKTLIFSSIKLKFVLKYVQSVMKWISKVVDTSNFSVVIDTTSVDRFNFSLFYEDNHIFNSTLFTNFYLIPEEEWATKIYEIHISKYEFENGDPKILDSTNFYKGEKGFEKLANAIYWITKEPTRYSKYFPIQWQIDFKDGKTASSQIRMQISSLTEKGFRPVDPFLTVEKALKIEQGVNPQSIIKKANQDWKDQETINPIWEEGIAQEQKYRDMNQAMKMIRGVPDKKKR
ncbi:hypothetical protein SSABA_v1c03440 [Spiroplasma sabaudiense Ar-1343]|uniref:Uncharacterized protein n=1 Tax=Spiroplasma sabaudiense Ar-1343 TaxID=1276257 RepID=W6A9F7_9MOLU|nr:hypothetical protein [Spiroplasma sabaudiense]AHI53753.1 hypothetical protein SSABA_v1c03440 [Spiroplasma sabaudiense Ar-1343]